MRDKIEEAKLDAMAVEMRRVEDMAKKNKLMLVRTSKYRFVVAERLGAVEAEWFAYFAAAAVYGPATREACLAYIRDHGG